MKRMSLFLIVAFMISGLPAVADNLVPPGYVGDPLSYHAEWEFNGGLLLDPDSESSVGSTGGEFLYDRFDTHIDVDGAGWGWDPADGDGGMVNTNRDGSFAINTINWVDEEPEKYIRVQLTYIGLAPVVTGANGYEYDGYHGGGTDTTDLGFFVPYSTVNVDPNHLYSDIYMQPNPDWEQIEVFVPQGTVIDEIVVDTISIPEPSTLAFMGVAGAIAVFLRRLKVC